MSTTNPRDPDGEPLCAWCGGPIQQSAVGRPKDYCSRTHREYAYRARREAGIRIAGYSRGLADARANSSTDGTRQDPVPSVDETIPAGRAPVPPQPAAPSPPPVRPSPTPPEPRRRRQTSAPPGDQAALPLPGFRFGIGIGGPVLPELPEDADGE
ncbi:hypothetical protein [Streptomyces sp. GbtcB6]|uniref:hypothetical protein n=1 Tax=Streptomyces sp. GbtcB6 TaxID=2824751 RepID=UPI001C310B3B|nr:hypothetical protein [Streptomyces sp. GbtcB6]